MRMTALGKIIIKDLGDRIKELEAENARLRQQLDAANAQLDFLIEEMNKTPHGALVLYAGISRRV